MALFVSSAAHHVLRKKEKTKLIEELRSVSYEDIPYVMVWLINKANERRTKCLIPNQDEAAPVEELCVACYENVPSIRNTPCGHKVLCRGCNWSLLRISIENRSPLICSWCRGAITDFEGEMRPNMDFVELSDIKGALFQLETVRARRKRYVGAAR